MRPTTAKTSRPLAALIGDVSEAGRRTREGQSQDQIADELRPAIEAIIDELDRWFRARAT